MIYQVAKQDNSLGAVNATKIAGRFNTRRLCKLLTQKSGKLRSNSKAVCY